MPTSDEVVWFCLYALVTVLGLILIIEVIEANA